MADRQSKSLHRRTAATMFVASSVSLHSHLTVMEDSCDKICRPVCESPQSTDCVGGLSVPKLDVFWRQDAKLDVSCDNMVSCHATQVAWILESPRSVTASEDSCDSVCCATQWMVDHRSDWTVSCHFKGLPQQHLLCHLPVSTVT